MNGRLVVHAHMHPRRTGVTTHVESVLPGLQEAMDVAWTGRAVETEVPRMSWSLIRRRAKLGPIVVHVHRNKEMIVALLLKAVGAMLRLVFTRHSAGRPGLLTRWLMKRADVVISPSKETARALPVESVVVPHGVDPRRFSPPRDRASAWSELGLGGELGIGVVGRVRPSKGQGDLVEAIEPLLPEHPEWQVVLVGSAGGHERFASRLSERAGPSLHLLGERRDMERIYRGLTVVVQPSHSEGFGLVLAEAMASGCCVVTTRTGVAAELVRDGETGFLFEAGDVDALRGILAKLMDDPGLADDVGRGAAREVASRCSVVGEIGALARIYGELLSDEE